MDTPFIDNCKINDIILDYRNFFDNKNFLGISGLRLVIADTWRFEQGDHYSIVFLKLSKKTKLGKPLTLNIKITLENKIFSEFRKYILSTYKKFKGHTIAILRIWEKSEDFNIECTLLKKEHLIFKI